MKDLAILILNYNSSVKIVEQVEKLITEEISASHFYIVDNNSDNEDRKRLVNFVESKNLNFIQSSENGGYAKGNNLAIEKAIEDQKNFFLILNPDIEISGAVVRNLYDILSRDRQLYIIGPRICDKDDREIIFSDGGKLYRDDFFQPDHVNVGKRIDEVIIPQINYDIDYINGSAMMFKKEALSLIGKMREDFFMYFEETEWCYRLQLLPNAEQAIVTSLVVYHELSKADSFKKFFMTRNRIYLCRLYNLPHRKFTLRLLYDAQKYLFNTKGNFIDNINLFFSQIRAVLEGEFRKLD